MVGSEETGRTGTTPARTGTGRGLSGTGWTIIGTTTADNIGELLTRLPKLRKDARASENTLLWVNEKGETVFDPSATGDEADSQRKEIDRLERELLLRGIVMCPRGPILERIRPWTGVLESLERFQSARRHHYKRLVEVMKGAS